MYESLIQELRQRGSELTHRAAKALEVMNINAALDSLIIRKFCDVRDTVGCDCVDDVHTLAKENRLFILPCPIGAPVFVIGRKYRHGRWENWVNPASFRLSDCEKLGKTVFLTEGEARNALARIKEVT